MLQDIGEARYSNAYAPHVPRPTDRLCLFHDHQPLVQVEPLEGQVDVRTHEPLSSGELPTFAQVAEYGFDPYALGDVVYLFAIGEIGYFTVLEEAPEAIGPFAAFDRVGLRYLRPVDVRFAVLTATQLHFWYRRNRFCGHCGKPTVRDERERMIRCPECGTMVYPRINPGVIVGVLHEDKLLMSKYAGRQYANFALIAGFTEIGEPIEDTVSREVMEEVGLKVKNITFHGSQPWAPSSSLLVGFYCELDGSPEITLDRTELAEAGWYTWEDVPVDDGYSLTSEMMGRFRDAKGDSSQLLVRR